jgi:hypothetical protein
MLDIPAQLKKDYTRFLTQCEVPPHSHNYYIKWLRFYLDFCNKYNHVSANRGSLAHFIKKLHEKNQTSRQQKQASHAISLYYALETDGLIHEKVKKVTISPKHAVKSSVDLTLERSAWEQIYADLDATIKMRHYSPKTYKSYSSWIRKLQYFTREKTPELLTGKDVKSFLTNLAVKQKVSASTQNQAFNALLFLFRHILKKDFTGLDGVVRAKRTRYIPVVLSRKEIDAILQHLSYPYDLVVKLLYASASFLSLRSGCKASLWLRASAF